MIIYIAVKKKFKFGNEANFKQYFKWDRDTDEGDKKKKVNIACRLT